MPTTDTKPVRLNLSPAEHQALRERAAVNGKPMSQFVRDIVLRELTRAVKAK